MCIKSCHLKETNGRIGKSEISFDSLSSLVHFYFWFQISDRYVARRLMLQQAQLSHCMPDSSVTKTTTVFSVATSSTTHQLRNPRLSHRLSHRPDFVEPSQLVFPIVLRSYSCVYQATVELEVYSHKRICLELLIHISESSALQLHQLSDRKSNTLSDRRSRSPDAMQSGLEDICLLFAFTLLYQTVQNYISRAQCWIYVESGSRIHCNLALIE